MKRDVVLPFAAMVLAASPALAGSTVVHQGEVPARVIAGGKASVKILLEQAVTGDGRAYLGVFTALPGTQVPEHAHKSEAEMLYILEGRGTLTLDGKQLAIQPGDAIFIAPGSRHSLVIDTAVQPLKALQVYAPAGPEQRFKKGKAVRE